MLLLHERKGKERVHKYRVDLVKLSSFEKEGSYLVIT